MRGKWLGQLLVGTVLGVCVLSALAVGLVALTCAGVFPVTHEPSHASTEVAFGRFAFLHLDGDTRYRWVPKKEYPAHWNAETPKSEAALFPQSKWTAADLTAQAAKNPHDPSRGAHLEVVGVTVVPTDPAYGPRPAFVELAGHAAPGADRPPTVVCTPHWSQRGAFRNIPVGHRVLVMGEVTELSSHGRTYLAYCTATDLGPADGK